MSVADELTRGFECHRYVYWTDEDGMFHVRVFDTKVAAREFAESMGGG